MVKINKDNLFLHIPDENLITIKKIVDRMELALKKHEILSTDFLNPYEVELAKSILNRFDIGWISDGGYDDAERRIIYLYPNYILDLKKDKVSCLSIEKQDGINHKDVLGSIIGLGVDRAKIGDIIFSNYIYIFVKNEQYEFLRYNLKKIGKYNIKFLDEPFKMIEKKFVDKKIIVSSLRLDNVLSSALNISRSKVNNLIKSGKVNVNFKVETKTSIQLTESDTLSVRGFGRIIFDNIENTTRKGNFVLNIKFPK